ncbi:MAG: hypothetical protein ABXS91_08550 [Sulfurimonas sp.]
MIKEYQNTRESFNLYADAFADNDIGTFSKSGLSVDEYRKELLKTKANLEKLQHADVFKVSIVRVEPYYDVQKSEIITSMMKSVSITHDGVETQEDRVGSGYINWHKGRQSGEIQAVFHEFQDGSVIDFLTKISNKNTLDGTRESLSIGNTIRGVATDIDRGINAFNSINAIAGNSIKPIGGIGTTVNGVLGAIGSGGATAGNKNGNIMPSDGTTLLPYDYYFKITISNLNVNHFNNTISETIVVDDEFIIEGNVSQDYATGNEEYLEVSATFKPIKSWR